MAIHNDPKPWLNPSTGERRAYSIWEGYTYSPRPEFDEEEGTHSHHWVPRTKVLTCVCGAVYRKGAVIAPPREEVSV